MPLDPGVAGTTHMSSRAGTDEYFNFKCRFPATCRQHGDDNDSPKVCLARMGAGERKRGRSVFLTMRELVSADATPPGILSSFLLLLLLTFRHYLDLLTDSRAVIGYSITSGAVWVNMQHRLEACLGVSGLDSFHWQKLTCICTPPKTILGMGSYRTHQR